LNPHALSDTGT